MAEERSGREMANLPAQPLAEVFGLPSEDVAPAAVAHRVARLCPFHNTGPHCTKSSISDPIGVCSLYNAQRRPVIICPVRFREGLTPAAHLIRDAAAFFFPQAPAATALREIRLADAEGNPAGNIDLVVVAYDPSSGQLLDFGALEVQSVYISGNIRTPFAYYMQDQVAHARMDWRGQPKYPRPDYLSSSRKRLVPQLITKGGILSSWGKKQAVAVDRTFFERFGRRLTPVAAAQADLVWLIYDLVRGGDSLFRLTLVQQVYTSYTQALSEITRYGAGPVEEFAAHLQGKLRVKLATGEAPPDAPAVPDVEPEGGQDG